MIRVIDLYLRADATVIDFDRGPGPVISSPPARPESRRPGPGEPASDSELAGVRRHSGWHDPSHHHDTRAPPGRRAHRRAGPLGPALTLMLTPVPGLDSELHLGWQVQSLRASGWSGESESRLGGPCQ